MRFHNPRSASNRLTELGRPRAPQTLAKLRVIGGGPRFRKDGARVVYEDADLIAWVKDGLSEPMASTTKAA